MRKHWIRQNKRYTTYSEIYLTIYGYILLLLVATLGGIGYAVREKLKEKERLTRECLILLEN